MSNFFLVERRPILGISCHFDGYHEVGHISGFVLTVDIPARQWFFGRVPGRLPKTETRPCSEPRGSDDGEMDNCETTAVLSKTEFE